jgi:hypothetical protein
MPISTRRHGLHLADGLAVLMPSWRASRSPKLAILCSFWIISIFTSGSPHPIILSFTPPPDEHVSGKGALERFGRR